MVYPSEKHLYNQARMNLKDSPVWYKRLHDVFKHGHRSGRLLDIGCSYGVFLRLCEPYFETYGIDISPCAVSQAKDYARRSNILLSDLERSLPFKDEAFDVVTGFDTLEHITNYKILLTEVRRILKKDGILLLTTPNRWSMNSILFGKDYWFKRDNSHVVLFSRNSLRRELSEAGYAEIKIRTISLVHFLGDFRYRKNLSERNTKLLNISQRRNWVSKIPTPLEPLLRRTYQIINDLPTPWGANLYAFCKKSTRFRAS